MSKENVGGAAFPTYNDHVYLGMSLRDYFAAKALQGLIADPNIFLDNTEFAIAHDAYVIADAMLKAREA